MSSEISLSIIVPFHNVEKYIAQCLDSILCQNIELSTYEVICVNDCSPDNSRDIVLAYQNKYSNLILIDHEHNTKVGGARNSGLKAAKGDYIWFVDSDDFIVTNCFKHLISLCNNNQLDVLSFNISLVNINGKFISDEIAFKNSNAVTTGIDYLNEHFGNSIVFHLGYPIRAIYKRSFLINIAANFPQDISYGEETIYLARSLVYANRVISLSNSYYFYRQNPLSVTANLETKYRGHLLFQSIFEAGKLVLDLYSESKSVNRELANNIQSGIPWFVNRLFIRLLKTSFKEQLVFFKEVNNKKSMVKNLLPFMNNLNYIISNYSIFGLVIINIIKPIYIIKRKIQTARKPKKDWCY